MTPADITTDICIIGAGSAGLVVAAVASQVGADVVLIEKDKMGGDCLNTGCVPSKALLSAAKHAHAMTTGAPFGISPVIPEVDFAKAMGHVQAVIAGIAPHDSVERFEGLGCKVILGTATLTGKRTVSVNGQTIRARYIVLATGSRAAVPPIPGLADSDFFTNETIFTNTTKPDHLVIIGAGAIGLEMAQAHRRLGAKVTVLEKFKASPKDDPALVQVVTDTLRKEGVDIREGVSIDKVEGKMGALKITVDGAVLEASHLLVAAGRAPNVDGLGLENAGVIYDRNGITVDDTLRTSNKRIYAIGDCHGGLMFTHLAGYDAGIVIQRLLFKLPAKRNYAAIPWVTYTDPELATVGMTETQAVDAYGAKTVSVAEFPYAENDRARAELATKGKVKVIVGKKGHILGASIVGKSAGEIIHIYQLALTKKMTMRDISSMVSPYPTLSEITKRAASVYYAPTLYSDKTRKVVRFLMRLFG